MNTKPSSSNSFLQGYLLKSVLSSFLVTTPSIVKFPSSFLFSAQLVLSKLWLVCSILGGLVSFSWQLFQFTPSYSCSLFEKEMVFRFIRGHPKGICPVNNSRIVLFLLGWHSKVFWSSIYFYAKVVVFLLQQDIDALHLFFHLEDLRPSPS